MNKAKSKPVFKGKERKRWLLRLSSRKPKIFMALKISEGSESLDQAKKNNHRNTVSGNCQLDNIFLPPIE
jgi:hypothetical protein